MGSNFHTPWTTSTGFCTDDMNGAPSTLDRALSYQKSLIVHCDGNVSYSILTGVLTWDDTIRIVFTNSNGDAVQNTIAAGSITLSDGQMCYVDLNETNDTVLTMQKASITTGAASNTIAYNRLVLGYRNTASDRLFSSYLDTDPDKLQQDLESDDLVVIDWSLGSLAVVTLDRATTEFVFTGGRDGQMVYLAMAQDATGNRDVEFGAEVRDGTDIILPLVLSAEGGMTDYAVFIYRDSLGYYDILDFKKGYGEAGS